MSEQGNTTDDVLKDRKQEKAEKDDGAAKSAVKDTADQLTKKQRKKLKKKFKAARKKAIKTALKTGGATIGAVIVMVLVAVFMIVGILIFVVTTPGMIQETLMQNIGDAIGGIQKMFVGTNNDLEEISHSKKLELLQYVQDMGIDVVGYGFVATADVNSEGKVIDFEEDLLAEPITDNEKITLYNYILASQRIYALDDDGLIGGSKLLGINKQSGMLNITNETFLDGIETSVENKRLNITVNNPHLVAWLNEDGFSYNLDGWSGRYGIPLDFTVSLHLATMSSGILNEIITHPDLQTTVNIELQKVNASVEYKLQTTDGSNVEITYDNGVHLYNKYAEGGIDNITKEDISVVGLVELADMFQTEVKDNRQVYLNDKQILSTTKSLGGVKKYIDAINALTGSSKTFYVDPNLQIGADNTIATYSSISTGVYICDYDKTNDKIDETTGIIGTKIVSDNTAETTVNTIVEYKEQDGGNTYVCFVNGEESNYDEHHNKVLLLDETKVDDKELYEMKKSKGEYFDKVQLDGLGNDKVAVLNTITQAAFAYCANHKGEIIKNDEIEVPKGAGDYMELLSFYNNGYMLKNNTNDIDDIDGNNRQAALKLYSYYRMFEQADFFIEKYVISNMAYCEDGGAVRSITEDKLNELTEKFNYDFNKYPRRSTEEYNVGGYYTEKFEEMCNNNNFSELGKLLESLKNDVFIINEDMKANSDLIDEILENTGYEGLSMDMINTVYVNARLNNDDVNFIQPRITSVIRHWFKDVDFSAKDTYKLTNSPYEIKYTGDSGLDEEKYVITAVIDPRDDSQYYTQSDQPYVVKGDVVTLEGKVVEGTSKLTPIDDKENYNWGDGYRATKKIFTQGSYYTYDGSTLTSRSIYYQEQIEHMSNQMCYIAVRRGGITVFSGVISNGEERHIGGETISNIGYSNGNWTSEVLDNTTEVDSGVDNVKIRHVVKTERHGDPDKNEDPNMVEEVNWYLLYIGDNAMKYKSPARDNNTYETSQKSVRNINNVWNAVGVTSLRKPVSFDNVVSNGNDDINSDGNLMAQTAFAILENSKSEDAEVIYRDLKELLIDLGYYTKAEFDYLSTNVLNWFIPDYLPKQWPQNGDDDVMQYGAFLYPYAEETDEDEQTEESNEEKIEGREDGFSPDLDIIAPGNCRIIDYSSDSIKIRFDGVSQPEIGILNNYTMIIKGIVTNSELTITGEDESETVISIKDAKDNNENTIIPSGTVIGKTGTSKIQVVMKNNRSAIINNIEDYMAPELREATNYGEVIEYATEFINSFEGISDADPNDGDFYTVSPKNNNPGYDIDTIGAGLTGWTYPFWESLGYGNYVINNPDYR